MRYEKRIEREIDILMGHYVVEPHKLDNSNMCLYIYDEHSRMMIVPITKKFPFKCPSVQIKNKDNKQESMYQVYHNLSLFYIHRMSELKELKSCCFCSHNLLSGWSPGNRILDLITECKLIESWFQSVRSGYFGEKSLIKILLIKDIVDYISTFIYATYPILN